MDELECIAYASSNATEEDLETSVQANLPPAIQSKISDVSY